MSRPSPHRRFVDPHDLSGIPKLNKHRKDWEPSRDPLPGTKILATPKDDGWKGRLEGTLSRPELRCWTSLILGWAAVLGVIGFWGLLWYLLRTPGVGLYSHGGRYTAVVILLLGVIHVLAIFSQIMSEGRNKPGAFALVGLYAGSIGVAVIDHWMR